MWKKKKTWDILGILLGLSILLVGIVFMVTPPESYRANSVDDISFGADYYTEQYNATRVTVNNTAVTANNLREIGQALAHYVGFFFIALGILTMLHYGKSYFTCDAARRLERTVGAAARSNVLTQNVTAFGVGQSDDGDDT